MTSKKAASLSSTLLARKGSAAPAGLAESTSAAVSPLPGALNADTDQKNGNGHLRPISLERPRKPSQTTTLDCDDPVQPPLIPGLATQTSPRPKADIERDAVTSPKMADRAKLVAEQEPPVPNGTPPPTIIKAAPPLQPQSPKPAPAEPPKDQGYPQPPKPRVTPVQTGQTLVAERHTRPEAAASTARLAAAAAGKTGDPMPGPAIAAIATVVILALAGGGYLFLSENGSERATTEVARPLAADTEPASGANAASTGDVASAVQLAETPAVTVASAKPDQVAIAVAARDFVPAPRPAATSAAIEPMPVSVETEPQADAEPSDAAVIVAATNTEMVSTAPDAVPPAPAAAGASRETTAAIEDGPAPAPHRPVADTSNIVPTVAGTVPLPAPKPTRVAAATDSPPGSEGRFAVQLASVPSAAAAKREIRRLKRAYPTLFGAMAIDVQRGRSSYRLMSQRFENRGEAANLCQSLKDAGRGCLILAR